MFDKFKANHGGLGPIQYANSHLNGGYGLLGRLGQEQQQKDFTAGLDEIANNESLSPDLRQAAQGAHTQRFGRDQANQFLTGLRQRANDETTINGSVNGIMASLDEAAKGENDPLNLKQINALRVGADYNRKLMLSGNQKLQDQGVQGMAQIVKAFEDYHANNEAQQIAAGVAKDHQNEIQHQQEQQRFANSQTMRGEMDKELTPTQQALDSMHEIEQLADVKSPFALQTVAYRAVMLMQSGAGSQRISDEDVKAARDHISSIIDKYQQAYASGVKGEGLLPQVKADLLAALAPLAAVNAQRRSDIVNKYALLSKNPNVDQEQVMGGLEPSLWKDTKHPSASESGLATTGGDVAEGVGGFLMENGASLGKWAAGALGGGYGVKKFADTLKAAVEKRTAPLMQTAEESLSEVARTRGALGNARAYLNGYGQMYGEEALRIGGPWLGAIGIGLSLADLARETPRHEGESDRAYQQRLILRNAQLSGGQAQMQLPPEMGREFLGLPTN